MTGVFIYPPFRKANGPFCGSCAGKIIDAFRKIDTIVGVEEESTNHKTCVGCQKDLPE